MGVANGRRAQRCDALGARPRRGVDATAVALVMCGAMEVVQLGAPPQRRHARLKADMHTQVDTQKRRHAHTHTFTHTQVRARNAQAHMRA